MEVIPISVLSDNYSYLLIDRKNSVAAAVDPVEAETVYNVAKEQNVQVSTILTTHCHADHAGGNADLLDIIKQQEKRDIPVYGGRGDGVLAVTHELKHNDTVKIGDFEANVYFTPCHTRGHVLYHCEDALFTGDTLFVAGCGRFFMGSPDEMHYALNDVVAKLPEDTKVYCGHEYTVKNLEFAAHVEPDNDDIKNKLKWAKAQREKNEITIPSTVGDELKTNPFMRVTTPGVQRFAKGETDPVKVMGILREAKNSF